MAITFLGAVVKAGTTLDLTPLGLAENDILILVNSDDNATASEQGSPWVTLSNVRPDNVRGIDQYLICGATPPTSVSITGNTSGLVAAFRGVDTTTTFDVTAPTATNGTAGMPNPPSITTVTDGAFVLAVGQIGRASCRERV
jgi:hypothetical protein